MRRQAGFTLVEMAIVLVIIGLLLGGVLKGQELIESAKVKNIAQDFRAISIAVLAYQDKYRALPGDDRNAATRWRGACSVTASGGTLSDGQITGQWNDGKATATEAGCVWDHLRRANLLTGGADTATVSIAPNNADGGTFGVVGPTGTAAVKGVSGSLIVCASNIRGRHVIPLDAMLDDSDPSTGAMKATLSSNTTSNAREPVAAAHDVDDNENYNVCMGF